MKPKCSLLSVQTQPLTRSHSPCGLSPGWRGGCVSQSSQRLSPSWAGALAWPPANPSHPLLDR